MGYNLLINGVYWGYSPLTNLLLTSWDIQVGNLPSKTKLRSIDFPPENQLKSMKFPEVWSDSA